MKFKLIYRSISLLLLLLSTSFSTYAQEPPLRFYPAMGHINELNSERIILGDFEYLLSPTAKVTLVDNKQGELANLKLGDFVGATVITINRRQMVDAIYKLDPPKR